MPSPLREALSAPFAAARWRELLSEIFPGAVQFERHPVSHPVPAERIRACREFGRVQLADERGLVLLEIEVGDNLDLLRNRVELRNLVAGFIDLDRAHGVMALIHSASAAQPEYRLTFAARASGFDAAAETFVTRETATRRFTYVLGPGETRKTAGDRLAVLAAKEGAATLEDVIAAFDVEPVSKEFFDRYKEHYAAFCRHLLESDVPAKIFKLDLAGKEDKELDRALKPVRDFVKKLLGRLVFLHFLQKKGWLGCDPTHTDWQGGSPEFLRQLFNSTPATQKDHFHSKRLVPLFFDTLNDPRRESDIFAVTGTRVPYLNGGLFERDRFFKGDKGTAVEKIDFPASLFSALLEFFGQYHFTIDENDPEDHEIGIDPEMLGHIFENLLEDNKDKGAYYTPKAVVQYMCQQSLIHALAGRFSDDEAARREIEQLIRTKEPVDARDTKSWLARHATTLAGHLDDLRICDPAIGSGAFPIGLLQEIYWTKLALNPSLNRAAAKRDIIQRSIHGVDLDAGAVEIARLRFWLALIVEEDAPVPLPNLDYQIMQGNSLLESFEGERLDDLTEPIRRVGRQRLGSETIEFDLDLGGAPAEFALTIHSPAQHQLAELRSGYFSCHEPEEKARLRGEIDAAVLRAIDDRLDYRRRELEDTLKRETAFLRGRPQTPKEEKRRAAMKAEVASLDGKRAKLHALLEDPRAERPFFLWHLWFRHVLAAPPEGRGGFDIVIANPPYGADIPASDAAIIRSEFETLANSLDSFIVFMEQATRLLGLGGALAFIIPCGWVSTPSSRKLRSLFARSFHPRTFASLPYDVFGEAYVDTMIVTATRLPAAENWEMITDKSVDLVVFPVRYRINELADFDRFHKVSDFGLWGDPSEDGFLVTSTFAEAELVAKLRGMPRQFDHFVEVMRGIETYNPQPNPLSEHSRRALVGDIYRYEVNHSGDGYIAYPPGIESGKPLRFFNGPRLLLRQLLSRKFRLQAGYTEDEFLTNQSVQSLLARDEAMAPIKVMLAVLNSKLISWYFCQINMVSRRDDFPKTIIKVTREIPLPDITRPEYENARSTLSALVDRILAAKRAGDEATVAELDAEIDTHVFRLYGLTAEEIELINGTSR